jgi:hypothetical protein
MAGIIRTVVRMGVITALAGGAAVVIAGPTRVQALLMQTRGAINDAIDRNIDDPMALRAQLRRLEEEYPRRIATLHRDLGEVRAQKAVLDRDLAISARVVSLADADLNGLGNLLEQAEDARAARSNGPYTIVRVRFGGQTLDLEEAYARQSRISQHRSVHASRAGECERDLGYLSQQEARLSKLLGQLETERAEFQAQLLQLDRQVDAIARNERMIEMMERRHRTMERYDSLYDVASLDQFRSKFEQIRSQQEARLQALAAQGVGEDYERIATWEYNTRRLAPGSLEKGVEVGSDVIEVSPPAKREDDGVIASLGR